MERAIRTVKAQIRAMKDGLETKYRKKIDLNDVVDCRPQWKGLMEKLNELRPKLKWTAAIDSFYHCCMSRVPFAKKYDVVYMNWGLSYLNDAEALMLLATAKFSLTQW